MKHKWLLIPIYGFARGLAEYLDACDVHRNACECYQANPSDPNRAATWRAFERTWPAMDKALAGLWITIGELMAMVIIGTLIAR